MIRARLNAATFATAVLLAAAAAWCVALAGGYFLSDDFVQLANFARWSEKGVLGEEVLRRFAGSIDGANAFWRPLTYASFAASYAMGGVDPQARLGVNLALHLANAILVAPLARHLAAEEHAHRAGLFAAIFFFALASGWGAALWIAARYDATATFFVCLWVGSSRSAGGRWPGRPRSS